MTKILVERGDRVVGVSRSRSPLSGPILRHEIQDVASPQYRKLLSRLLVEEGPFDACIYCAGIGSALKLPDLSNETQVLEVKCLDGRPIQLSIPKLAAVATWAIGCLQLLRVWMA